MSKNLSKTSLLVSLCLFAFFSCTKQDATLQDMAVQMEEMETEPTPLTVPCDSSYGGSDSTYTLGFGFPDLDSSWTITATNTADSFFIFAQRPSVFYTLTLTLPPNPTLGTYCIGEGYPASSKFYQSWQTGSNAYAKYGNIEITYLDTAAKIIAGNFLWYSSLTSTVPYCVGNFGVVYSE